MRLVAIGGGHGLAQTLRAARRMADDVTALVSMADDGGSSGKLRREFHVPPPGDVRMALLALADESQSVRTELWGHRFDGEGALAGHSLGNLLLTALWQRADGQESGIVQGIATAADLLGVSGAVLPISTAPHHLVADVLDGDGRAGTLHGQAAVTTSGLRIEAVRTDPAEVPVCPAAAAAIAAADIVVLGPGSWFTSVLAPLAVAGVCQAINDSRATVVLVVNLRPQPGETEGFTASDYLRTFMHAHPALRVDAVVADSSADRDGLRARLVGTGAQLLIADLDPEGSGAHDPAALAAVLQSVEIHPR